jgi:hypothetical protein
MLELELRRIRSEASAARLDARAAEIELVMRRLRANQTSETVAIGEPTAGQLNLQHLRVDEGVATPEIRASESPRHRFKTWNEVRSAQLAAGTAVPISKGQVIPESLLTDDSGSESLHGQSDIPIQRIDAAHQLPRHHFDAEADADDNPSDENSIAEQPIAEDSVAEVSDQSVDQVAAQPVLLFTTGDLPHPTLDGDSIEFAGRLSEAWQDDEEPEQQQRGKPAALLVSALVHVVVLLILAAIGLRIHDPKDQVAFSASTQSSEETAMESFSIESVDEPIPETEVTEPTPAEVEYEVSPIGEFKAADLSTDTIVNPISSMAAAMASQSSSAAAVALKSDSVSKMKFCGVEGGGNHFVYLVDSSGSMGDAFESARRELLASIDLLSPDQRFYVVFFDAQPDFMRISNPGVDEPRSVYATAQNKAALRRWAMRIKMDRGKAPYDPLKFALGLRPDVIFLLSDGEFPEGIPDLLKEENRIENLFGETKPISIVHTISYFSEEGANIMTRIAKQNSGQYRYVPKP